MDYQMQLVNKERTPEGIGMGKVDDKHSLDTAELRVVSRRLLNLIDACIRRARHDVKCHIPQRQRNGQKQHRDVWL